VGNLPKALKMELAAFDLALGDSFHNKLAMHSKESGHIPLHYWRCRAMRLEKE